MRLFLPFATVLLAAPTLAQPTPPAPDVAEGAATPAMTSDAVDQRAKLMAMDTDHDGKWSRAEWLAGGRRERGFDFMDTDKDGYLTPAELKAGMTKLRAMRGGRQP